MNNNDNEKTQIRKTSANRISVLRYNSLSPAQVHGGKGRRLKQVTDYSKQSPGQGLAADSLYDNAGARYHYQYISTGDVGAARPCGGVLSRRSRFVFTLFGSLFMVMLRRLISRSTNNAAGLFLNFFFFPFFLAERSTKKEIRLAEV